MNAASIHNKKLPFYQFADTIPVMIWTADTTKLCTHFNKYWLQFTGKSLEQEIGNGWVKNVHILDLDRCLKTYVEAFDNREEFNMEYRMMRADGEYRWITDNGIPQYDEKGRFTGYIGTCIDVTDLKNIQETLHTKHCAIESSISGMAIASLSDENFIYANPSFAKIHGYENTEELLALKPSDLYADPKEAFNIIETLKSSNHWNGEVNCKKKNGGIIHALYAGNIIRDHQNKPISALITLIDNTRMKQYELRADWLSGILHMSHSEIFIFDFKTYQFIEANHITLANLGYSLEELKQITPLAIKPLLSAQQLDELLEPLRNHRQDTISFETMLQRKDGSLYPVEIRVQILSINIEEPAYVAVAIDLTQQKAAEARLNEALTKAEYANIDKSRFLAAASHDIKQPLNAATLFASVLLNKTNDPKLKNLMEMQLSALTSLGEMLDRLLDVSKLDIGSIKPEICDFNLTDILKKIEDMSRPEAENKKIKLKIKYNKQKIHSDPVLLSSIIQNFVTNAIKFTEKGKILIGCRHKGDTLRIDVIDQGFGIKECNFQKIFQEFYQVDNPAREKSKGQGLGLAISKKMARLLNHPLEMNSNYGKGSRFSISVPLVSLNTKQTSDDAEISHGMCHFVEEKTILIIDDNLSILTALQLLLEDQGLQVIATQSSKEALAIISDINPDMIISDLRLPGELNGFELIDQIRHILHDNARSAAIITGDSSPHIKEIAEEQSILLLSKPMNAERINTLNQYILSQT